MTPTEELAAWQTDRDSKFAALPVPLTVAVHRQAMLAWSAPNDDLTGCQPRSLKTITGGLKLEWTRPDPTVTGPSKGEILYIHGAAPVGSAQSYRPLAARLAASTPASVAVLDYRRPPEFHFPAVLDDVLTALAWLEASGHPMSDLVMAADSFGAMPMLAAVIRRRAAGLPLPVGLYMLCPDTNYSNRGYLQTRPANPDPDTCERVNSMNQYFDDPAFPCGGPDASPYYADLSGLPPILMHESRMAPLAHALELRDRLIAEPSASFTFRDWPDVPHIFPSYVGWFTHGAEAIADAASWSAARLA